MLLIFIRTFLIFIVMFAIIRLMGKRQIGEMQPFEFVITLLIAELACIPMADVSIPISYGIAAILTLFLVHQLFAVLGKKSIIFNRIISSRPSIVIDSDGINFDVLKTLNISIDELQENLRNQGYSNFDEVEYVIVETNGKFSILKKAGAQQGQTPLSQSSDRANGKYNIAQNQQGSGGNSTQNQGGSGSTQNQSGGNYTQNKSGGTQLQSDYKTPLPVCIIEEGKFIKWETDRLEIDQSKIFDILKKQGCTSIEQVDVATLDNNGKLYFQLKGKPYGAVDTGYKRGAW